MTTVLILNAGLVFISIRVYAIDNYSRVLRGINRVLPLGAPRLAQPVYIEMEEIEKVCAMK